MVLIKATFATAFAAGVCGIGQNGMCKVITPHVGWAVSAVVLIMTLSGLRSQSSGLARFGAGMMHDVWCPCGRREAASRFSNLIEFAFRAYA